uniref:Uncharacterized protein n=1 Tax=Anopheles maculatus TaxID=74869 RepID=A0A182T3I6_9DIPT
DNACALLAGTAHIQRCAVDNLPEAIPSNTIVRLNVIAKQKRLQRKLVFDSNRCLGENTSATLPLTVDERTSVPLGGIILECPLAKEEQEQVFANCNTLDGRLVAVPDTTLQTTTDFSSSRTFTSTLTEQADATTTNTTTTTRRKNYTATALVEPIPVSGYSFQHPYGCSRYNILRKQELRREKRRQLYDKTRKFVSKGTSFASVAVLVGSPKMDARVTHHNGEDNSVATDHNDDTSVYYSFTSVDMENDVVVPTVCPLALAASRRHSITSIVPLFLIFAAWFGMLALLMFCLGDLNTNTILQADGR